MVSVCLYCKKYSLMLANVLLILMTDVFTEILTCNDKPLMQVLIVSSHAIDGFISFLENMTVCSVDDTTLYVFLLI